MRQRPRLRDRFHVRISAIYACAVLFVFIGASVLIYRAGVRSEIESVQYQLEATALGLSSAIPPQRIRDASAATTQDDPAVRALLTTFARIADHYPRIKSIYVLRATSEVGQLRFVADYSPHSRSAEPGELYDASGIPVMREGFERPSVETEPVSDEWGTTLSGYSPVIDEKGVTLAMVGVDMDASRIDTIKREVLLGTLLVLGAATLLIALGAYFIGRNVERPLSRVIEASEAIARGHFDQRVGLDRKDEFGVLGQHFDRMAEGLQERDFIRETFGRYVSEDVAASLLADKEAIELGGEERVVTVLFSDLKGYSTLSEALSPTQVVAFLNAYLAGMNAVIDTHRGCVIEYLGDAILAVFGAPNPLENHAELAVRCADAMRARLTALGEEWEASGFAHLWSDHGLEAPSARIGVHTGKVVAGNLGSPTRMKYAVIGDNVNVAARLEQLNKELHTSLLFSEVVYEALPESLRERARAAGSHAVKGRAQAVDVYTID